MKLFAWLLVLLALASVALPVARADDEDNDFEAGEAAGEADAEEAAEPLEPLSPEEQEAARKLQEEKHMKYAATVDADMSENDKHQRMYLCLGLTKRELRQHASEMESVYAEYKKQGITEEQATQYILWRKMLNCYEHMTLSEQDTNFMAFSEERMTEVLAQSKMEAFTPEQIEILKTAIAAEGGSSAGGADIGIGGADPGKLSWLAFIVVGLFVAGLCKAVQILIQKQNEDPRADKKAAKRAEKEARAAKKKK